MRIQQVVARHDHQTEDRERGDRQLHQRRHQHHAPADRPQDAGHLVAREAEIEGPAQAHERELEEDEPETARDEPAREAGVLAAVEEGARPGQEHERGRAEVRHPAREEDARRRAAGGHRGEHAHVVERHQDHHRPAHEVDRGETRAARHGRRGRAGDGGRACGDQRRSTHSASLPQGTGAGP
jgi:hypothetical protein